MSWEPITAISAAVSAVATWLMWRHARKTEPHRHAARVATLRLLVVQSDLVRIRGLIASENVERSHIDALLEGNMMGTEQTLVNVRTFLPELVPELRGKMMEERHVRRDEAA